MTDLNKDTHPVATIRKVFSGDDIRTFADITFDMNPLHLDDDYQCETSFGQRIVHGMHLSGLISAVVGTKLPGPGTIFLRQSLEFLAPVFIGDQIDARVEVLSVTRKGRVSLKISCVNQHSEVVVEGLADVKAPRSWVEQRLN